jgi:hypothetical protein
MTDNEYIKMRLKENMPRGWAAGRHMWLLPRAVGRIRTARRPGHPRRPGPADDR